jgi:uncharacterized protein
MSEAIEQFAKAKYLSLETFRKTGVGVRTPVWFVQQLGSASDTDHALFFLYSAANAGKLKRIRNNPKVRIAPCNVRGDLRGEWVEARARMSDGEEAARGQQLLRQRYGFLKIAGDFFGRLMGHKQAVIAIEMG